MIFYIALTLVLIAGEPPQEEQTILPTDWFGTWEGQMEIPANPTTNPTRENQKATENVPVKFEVLPMEGSTSIVWRMSFGTGEKKNVKDYKLVPTDTKDDFLIDENGIVLHARRIDKVIHSHFSFDDMVLAARYELRDGKLLFEVTTAKPYRDPQFNDKVQSYRIISQQSVLMTRKN